jgi:hypothetical protein
MKPNCVNHRKAELSLRQVLGEALVVRILLQTQVSEIVANLLKNEFGIGEQMLMILELNSIFKKSYLIN